MAVIGVGLPFAAPLATPVEVGVLSSTLADLQLLVTESARAGIRVDLSTDIGGPAPEGVGRTAYRIVQEGLTNARKHAPGAEAHVRLAGMPGQGLTVEARNASPAADPESAPTTGPERAAATAPAPPPGQGLVGLAERVALADGRLEHQPTADGGWRLAAWLPWAP